MFWSTRQQLLCKPSVENIRVDITIEQPEVKELKFSYRAYSIDSASCMPIFFSVTLFALDAIAFIPWGVNGKATFIYINCGTVIYKLVAKYLELEYKSRHPICLRMEQRFFYS